MDRHNNRMTSLTSFNCPFLQTTVDSPLVEIFARCTNAMTAFELYSIETISTVHKCAKTGYIIKQEKTATTLTFARTPAMISINQTNKKKSLLLHYAASVYMRRM